MKHLSKFIIILFCSVVNTYSQDTEPVKNRNIPKRENSSVHPTPNHGPIIPNCKEICDGNTTCLTNCQSSCLMYPKGKCPDCIKKFCGPDFPEDCQYINCISCTMDSVNQTPEGILNCAVCLSGCKPGNSTCYDNCMFGIGN